MTRKFWTVEIRLTV